MTPIQIQVATLKDDKRKLELEVKRLCGIIDKLLAHCKDAECEECGKIICPEHCPLHFHHDGCPMCCNT